MRSIDRAIIANAWRGRISGCQLGKPVEGMSMREGVDQLRAYLNRAGALPLRDYIPWERGLQMQRTCCKGHITRAEPDDDINYSVLALQMLEQFGRDLTTADVGRSWLRRLPLAAVFTAEREAYVTLANKATDNFAFGEEPGFDLGECADNPFNDWIGAQIRTDVYGWVNPGNPSEAARLSRIDAELSHRGAGVDGAVFVAACGAAIPVAENLSAAVKTASAELPPDSAAAAAIEFGRSLVGREDAVQRLHAQYGDLSPVHTLNNLALVVWALLTYESDFSAAIGEAVAAGWDTDCNGATVGALWGLTGQEIPAHWIDPWQARVGVTLAGESEIQLEELVDRTVAVAERLSD